MTSETDANDPAQAQINVSEIPVVGCSSSPTLMLVGRKLGEMQMRRKLANTYALDAIQSYVDVARPEETIRGSR